MLNYTDVMVYVNLEIRHTLKPDPVTLVLGHLVKLLYTLYIKRGSSSIIN